MASEFAKKRLRDIHKRAAANENIFDGAIICRDVSLRFDSLVHSTKDRLTEVLLAYENTEDEAELKRLETRLKMFTENAGVLSVAMRLSRNLLNVATHAIDDLTVMDKEEGFPLLAAASPGTKSQFQGIIDRNRDFFPE